MSDFMKLLDRPIALHRSFIDITGSVTAALFLTQAVYWQKRAPHKAAEKDEGGWWNKSQAEWTEETGLSRREQETARQCLKQLGVLEERRSGVPAKLWYRVDKQTLTRLLNQMIDGQEPGGGRTAAK